MHQKDSSTLRIGVLGAGPIAQAAHFDAIRKSYNAALYAICDSADDLLERMAAIHQPQRRFNNFDEMLADPKVDAVVIGVADQFHVPLATRAIQAGKHVLVEKPLGVNIEECEALREVVKASGLIFQIGNNYRFDPGFRFAHQFVQAQMGQRMGLKAWYYDSAFRYTMTDNVQPIPIVSANARRPAGNPKADKQRYYMLTHGSHLVDIARYLAGEIVQVQARFLNRFESYGWYIAVDFADGGMGHLDLMVPIQGDFEVGFQMHGERGSVKGRASLPWYHKSSEVECFSSVDREYHRKLGEDAYTYKLQIEGFANCVLHGAVQEGANIDDGLAAMRAMVAIAQSVKTGQAVRLSEVSGAVG